jgi:hypothetical protein
MSTIPTIFITRKGRERDDMPKSADLNKGDVVILSSGDILVWCNNTWKLLPGRFLKIEQLKYFIGYIGSGWPSGEEEIKSDLVDKVSKRFIERVLPIVRDLNRDQEGSLGQSTL